MASPMITWFESEIFSWRVFATITWTILLQFSWLFLTLLLSGLLLDPFHPLTSLSSAIHSLLTPSSWLYDLLIIACLVYWGSHHAKNFSLVPTVLHSWASVICSALTPLRLASLASHTSICGLITWCYVKLHAGPFANMAKLCEEDGTSLCLNENHMFIILSGCFTGANLWARYHFNNDNLITFPAIFQSKSGQLRLRLPQLVWSSALNSLLLLRYYYATYFIFGQFIIQPLASLLGMPVTGPLASLVSYLNISLALHCWVSSLLLHLTSSTLTTTATVYLTSPLHLELPALMEALSCDLPLLRHLCLQDLAQLAANSDPARAQLYTLSQPGGHPHNWNTLSSTCLSSLDSMTSQLSDITSPKPAADPPPPPKKEEPVAPFSRMRRLAPVSSSSPVAGGEVQDLALVPAPTQALAKTASNVWSGLKKKPLLSLLFSSPPDSSLRSVFAKSQPVIWSLDVLSHLVSASLTEDRFGVVQKQLPVILTSLLSLEAQIERSRGPGQLRRASSLQLPDVKLLREVRAAVKSAIYRIVVTFGEHILSVPLSREFQQKMKNYQTFMEASS